ncbi:hypothetical protein [Mesorhizobium sp.]|uniref:hypothetical protein n=1 Tax=Mesorhizobium sp. TaxID=1871066 RepID=UPI0025C35ECC|nr:hypothetical protein [Mesorhizobium sp.]
MLRPVHALLLSCFALMPLAGGAFAAQSSSDKPDDAAKKAALAEAISTCDRGASVPLDPEAKAPPVQYGALFPFDMNFSKLKDLADKCQAAMLGAPQEKRLTLSGCGPRSRSTSRGWSFSCRRSSCSPMAAARKRISSSTSSFRCIGTTARMPVRRR